MNRVLAETLSFLNGVIALVAIVAFALFGFRTITFAGPFVGLLLGAVAGVIIAAFICGMVAYVALIERHLAKIAANGADLHFSPTQAAISRQEPTL